MIPAELINDAGAVSEPVAQRMAQGALQHSGADIVVSVTAPQSASRLRRTPSR